jgi:predicted HNH restriction endonuclease
MNEEYDLIKEGDDLKSVVIEKGDIEGRTIKYFTTKYERSRKNRKAAIKARGTKCMACDFDFRKKYGELGEEFIEVHHIKALFDLEEEIPINPSTDLVCLCSNCHRMIHKKKGKIISVDELKKLIERNKREK